MVVMLGLRMELGDCEGWTLGTVTLRRNFSRLELE